VQAAIYMVLKPSEDPAATSAAHVVDSIRIAVACPTVVDDKNAAHPTFSPNPKDDSAVNGPHETGFMTVGDLSSRRSSDKTLEGMANPGGNPRKGFYPSCGVRNLECQEHMVRWRCCRAAETERVLGGGPLTVSAVVAALRALQQDISPGDTPGMDGSCIIYPSCSPVLGLPLGGYGCVSDNFAPMIDCVDFRQLGVQSFSCFEVLEGLHHGSLTGMGPGQSERLPFALQVPYPVFWL
jgi:hypothetical protein